MLHAMLRCRDVKETVAFWESRGARVLSRLGKAGNCFVGYGEYRDMTHFALELAQAEEKKDEKEEVGVTNTALAFIGLSALSKLPADQQVELDATLDKEADPLARFLLERKLRMPAPGTDPNGVEVRSVASAPGDPLSRLCLHSSSLDASADFYLGLLAMKEVARSEDELCVRYERAVDESGTPLGVPTTLVLVKRDGFSERQAPESSIECFDHIAISCRNITGARAFFDARQHSASVILEPTDMFGTVVMGLSDPDGHKVYLVEEAGFRAGA